jgi:hypothetical protein
MTTGTILLVVLIVRASRVAPGLSRTALENPASCSREPSIRFGVNQLLRGAALTCHYARSILAYPPLLPLNRSGFAQLRTSVSMQCMRTRRFCAS